MASESPRIEVRENEVLLFKNGQPVLRVERGTTLRIIKLLYQADLRNKGTVIGVRPQTNDVLPCVLTLDHSPLELARYEIIAFESTQETPFQTTRVTTAAKSLPQESFSNTSRYPLPTDGVGVGVGSSRQQQEDPSDILHEMVPSVMQKRQSINHTVPLTVNVSPETTRRSLVSQGTTGGSSSLLLTKKDIFPSCSSGFSLSRRKKTARKSVLPRRISSISSPIHSLGKHNHGTDEAFFQNKVTAHSTSPVLAGRLVGLDEVTGESAEVEEALDSPGLCDSTENENLANEEPARTGDEEPLTEHQQAENHNANHLPSYSVEDSAEFPNYHSIESSSTNGSSPSISEGQSMVIDIIDSRESSCGENDSDSNHVSSKHSSHQQRLCISGLEASSGVRYKEDATINQGRNDCSHTPTAVVLLENTVQVKMEPKEMAGPSGNTLPDQNGKDINFPFSMNSNGESNDALNSEDHYQTQKLNSMLISSQDGDSSSLPMQQAPALLPQVVSVVGAASEGKTAEDSYHHHHHHHDHRAQDTGDRHNCDVCQKQFDSPNSVLRHKRSHTGERPYICKICGWGFNLSGNLNQHLAIHQKVKPFKCVYCGKTFARSNVLKAHVRCHTGERPFQCQLCGSKFIIGHNLRKHMVTRHGIKEDDKMYLQNNVQGSDGSSQPSENGDHE